MLGICARHETWKYAHLNLGDEIVCILLRGTAVHLVDVLRDHARVCRDARLSRNG